MYARLGLALIVIGACAKKRQPAPKASDASVVVDGELEYGDAPPIPEALTKEIVRYIDNTVASIVDVSDDHTMLLRFGPRFVRMAGPDAALHTLHEAAGIVGGSMMLGDKLVYSEDDGSERAQIVVHDPRAKTSKKLPGVRAAHGFLSVDDDTLVVGDQLDQSRFNVQLFRAPFDELGEVLVENDGLLGPACASKEARSVVVHRHVGLTEAELTLVDISSGKTEILVAGELGHSFGGCRFAPDGESLLVLSNRGDEFAGLHRVVLATKEWSKVGPSLEWDIEHFSISPDETIAFVTNENGYNRLYLHASGETTPVELEDSGVIGSLAFAGPVLYFYLHPPTGGRQFYTFLLSRRSPIRWGRRWKNRLAGLTLIEPENFSLPSFDGAVIHGLHYRPRGDGPFPVFVHFHGGPTSQSRPSYGYGDQVIVNRGIAVVRPNVRGSTGFGRRFERLDNGAKRADVLRDVGALLEWIAKHPTLDAKRVCVSGGSYGGFVSLASLAEFGDRIKCGISIAGVTSLADQVDAVEAFRREFFRSEWGDERDPKIRAFLEELSPNQRADSITGPVLLIHGALDPRVPIASAKELASSLRRRGREVWTLWSNDDGHSLVKSRLEGLGLTLLFLDKHLRGREP